LSFGHRKSGSLWLALAAGVWLVAPSALAAQPSPPKTAKTTAPQKSARRALPGRGQPATKNRVAKSKTTHTAAKKGTSRVATKSATKKRASPAPATASARKPVTHTTGAATTHKAAAVRKTGTGNKPVRGLTGRQRLARLHLDPDRVQEIQQALARESYLQGDANGRWDDRTRAAMLRYQTDHGFSTTGLPDAKSLMKLGLGPHPLAPELDPGLAHARGPDAAKGNPPAEPLARPASGEETTLQEK
jgi:hypothetical protein